MLLCTMSITPTPCCSVQMQCPVSAELANKVSLEYFLLQVNFGLSALSKGGASFQGQKQLF